MLLRKRYGSLCALLGYLPLPAVLMDKASIAQSPSQAEGVPRLLRQGDRLVATLEGWVRVAQTPYNPSRNGETPHPWVSLIQGSKSAVLLRVVEGHPCFTVLSGRDKLSHEEQVVPIT